LKINEIDAKRGVVLGLRTNWTQSIAAGDKEFVLETKANTKSLPQLLRS
jgi:hypothetical protein